MDLGVCKNKTVDSLFELAKVGGVTALENTITRCGDLSVSKKRGGRAAPWV